MKKSVLAVLSLVFAGYASRAVPAEMDHTKRFLSPKEVIKIVEESDVVYQIATGTKDLEDANVANAVDKLFPLAVQPITCPVRVQKEDGSTVVAEMVLPPEEKKVLDEAEAHFARAQLPEAMVDYQRFIALCPNCYLAYAHLGDAYFQLRQFENAIEYFDTAIALNPCDHRTFVYRADALMQLGRFDEAKAAFIHSLSLCPRYWLALTILPRVADKLGVEVRTSLFQPQTYVASEPNGITVYLGDKRSTELWLLYGLVKAIWRGEPSHRQEMLGAVLGPSRGESLGDSTYKWSVVEETEALLNLLAVYEVSKQDGKVQPDPKLDLLVEINQAGDLPNFILYEITSRMCPYVTLTLSEDQRESLRGFIARYVVVSVPRGPGGKANEFVAAEVALPGLPERQDDQFISAH